MDNLLLKNTATQKVAHKRFEVARIHGEIIPSLDNQLIFDELQEPRALKLEDGRLKDMKIVHKEQFERKSLFLMSKEYRLIELQ